MERDKGGSSWCSVAELGEGLRDWVCWGNRRQRSKPMTRLLYLCSSELFTLKERQTLNLYLKFSTISFPLISQLLSMTTLAILIQDSVVFTKSL